jgi:lysophospholipase L1-like esterase
MRQWFANAALVVATLLVLALAGEATVRVLQANDRLIDYRKPSERRTQQRTPKLIRSSNPKLFAEFDPADPLLNELGMRGPMPRVRKAEGGYRIAVLGDSVAFGYGLKDEQSFPRVLETMLNREGEHRVEIINFAVCGYGLEAYAEVYRTKVRAFDPDLVLLGYVLNDPAPTAIVFEAIAAQLKQEATLRRIATYSQFAAWVMDTYSKAIDRRRSTQMFNDGYFKPEYREVIDREVRTLSSLTEADGIPLVIFIFPYFHDMTSYPLESVHGVLHEILRTAGLRFHDLLEDYRGRDAIALRLEDGDYTHPNAEGQRIAAEAMARYLERERLIPPVK